MTRKATTATLAMGATTETKMDLLVLFGSFVALEEVSLPLQLEPFVGKEGLFDGDCEPLDDWKFPDSSD